MINRKRRLILEQIDRKIKPFAALVTIQMPEKGWINTIREALNISLRQLGMKLGVTAQAIKSLETNEKNGTISIQSLADFAKAIDMKLVYGFVPIDGSLEALINKKAARTANQIIERASNTMKLEDQENTKERLDKAYFEKLTELKNEMPKYLWD